MTAAHHMKHCAYLSMDDLSDFECYDELTYPAMHALGWQVSVIPWRTPDTEWRSFDLVVIRSPWDYAEDPTEFMRVLRSIEASGTPLENPTQLVQGNINKTYLQDLAHAGIPTVPTLWYEKIDSVRHLYGACDALDSQHIVIKPSVGAGGLDTFQLQRDELLDKPSATALQATRSFARRTAMIQPFMPDIVSEGEYSLFYFNGQYSHCVLKTPKQGEFRVQEEYGSRLLKVNPEQPLLQLCMETLETLDRMPLYARVDWVRTPRGFALMELELIEPSLYFNMDPGAAQRFAEAVNLRMRERG